MAVIKMDFLEDSPEGEVQDSVAKPGAIRVILADSQAIYRVGIRKVFALEDDVRVVAQADSIENLHAAVQRYPTDVVLLEGGMLTGTANAIPELLRSAPRRQDYRSGFLLTTKAIPLSFIAGACAASFRELFLRTFW